MPFVIATIEVPDQERLYYAGLKRKTAGPRVAYRTTHLREAATRFDAEEEAEETLAGLDDGYQVIPMPK
jgi:hypothetical protein